MTFGGLFLWVQLLSRLLSRSQELVLSQQVASDPSRHSSARSWVHSGAQLRGQRARPQLDPEKNEWWWVLMDVSVVEGVVVDCCPLALNFVSSCLFSERLVLQPTRMCSSGPGTVQWGQEGCSLSLSCRVLWFFCTSCVARAMRLSVLNPMFESLSGTHSMWISSSWYPPTSPAALSGLCYGSATSGCFLLSHRAMTFSYRCLLPEWCCSFKAKVEKVEKLVFPVEMLYNKNVWMANLSSIKVI